MLPVPSPSMRRGTGKGVFGRLFCVEPRRMPGHFVHTHGRAGAVYSAGGADALLSRQDCIGSGHHWYESLIRCPLTPLISKLLNLNPKPETLNICND